MAKPQSTTGAPLGGPFASHAGPSCLGLLGRLLHHSPVGPDEAPVRREGRLGEETAEEAFAVQVWMACARPPQDTSGHGGAVLGNPSAAPCTKTHAVHMADQMPLDHAGARARLAGPLACLPHAAVLPAAAATQPFPLPHDVPVPGAQLPHAGQEGLPECTWDSGGRRPILDDIPPDRHDSPEHDAGGLVDPLHRLGLGVAESRPGSSGIGLLVCELVGLPGQGRNSEVPGLVLRQVRLDLEDLEPPVEQRGSEAGDPSPQVAVTGLGVRPPPIQMARVPSTTYLLST